MYNGTEVVSFALGTLVIGIMVMSFLHLVTGRPSQILDTETEFVELFISTNLVQYIHYQKNHHPMHYQAWKGVINTMLIFGRSREETNPHFSANPIGALHYSLVYHVQNDKMTNEVITLIDKTMSFIESEIKTHGLDVPVQTNPKSIAMRVACHPLLKL